MTLARPQGGISAARTRRVLGTATPARGRRHGAAVAKVATLAVLGLLVGGSPAVGAIVVTAGPTYTPGGTWSCTTPTAGSEKLSGGATYTCTGTAGAFSNLYIGIKNNVSTTPIGEKMNSNGTTEPSGAEIFAWSSEPGSTIVYTGTTTVDLAVGGTKTVFTRHTLTFSGTGSVIDDARTQGLTTSCPAGGCASANGIV